MFFSFKRTLVGLDIGSGSIKMLKLKKKNTRYMVERFGVKSLPTETIVDGAIMDSHEVVSAIKALADEQKLAKTKVAISISGTSVIVKKISMPPMSDQDLEKQIKIEAEQYIPFDINDVYLDFHVLSKSDGTGGGQPEMSVLLVATKKDKLNDYTNAVREAGLVPKVVDVDAFAVENTYCANYAPPADELTALVNLGASVMNINILKGGTSAFTRDITIGGNRYTERIMQECGLSYDEAEKAKKAAAAGSSTAPLGQVLAAVDLEIATEIGRSFDYFRTTSSYEDIARIVLSGGCANIKSLQTRIAEQLGIYTTAIDPFQSMDVSPLRMNPEQLAELAPAAAVVVGLALRREGDR